ncbi:MAG: dienelactone hydrolase family protein [Actinomycetota bacterium]
MDAVEQPIRIAVLDRVAGSGEIEGDLRLPRDARGLVLFAHGSGSSRHSPRNRMVADVLNADGLATLLFDLLTPAEEAVDLRTRHLRFDIALLAERLLVAGDSIADRSDTADLGVGTFGASTGAAAALVAAAERPASVRAVVSRGGRPDLAGDALGLVRAPTLLIVGSLDREVLGMNRDAAARMTGEVEITVVPGATHLFEEPGTLDEVARLASEWFTRRLSV